MALSPGWVAWKLAFGISPIIFSGGIAQNMLGGYLPIMLITQAVDFASGILTGASEDIDLDDFFALYEPLPGAEFAKFAYGEYPFANQSVAANAVIQVPLRFSMLMVCPVKGTENWLSHLAVMEALQGVITLHATLGGTYIVATPKQIFTNCLLESFTDATANDSKQPQSMFRWDFYQPLLTLSAAAQAQNSLMSKMSSGTQMSGQPALSGGGPVVGSPSSLATPPTVPAAQPLTGAGVVST